MDKLFFRRFEMDDLDIWADSSLWDGEKSLGRYSLPVRISRKDREQEGARLAIGNPPNETYRLKGFYCAQSPDSHKSALEEAIDFLVPDGTVVLAAADGVVTEVIEHNDKWGNGEEFRELMNRVTIQHPNGEYTQYCHLAKGSVSANGVSRMYSVRRGQPIGVVGKTGWTDRDHLHFLVFRAAINESPFTFKSLKPRWRLW